MIRRGFTILEVMIVVVLLGAVGAVAINFISGATLEDDGAVQEEALEFASAMGLRDTKVTCTMQDMNQNGYVSCTLSYLQGDVRKFLPLDCARTKVSFKKNRGCKLKAVALTQ